MALIGGVEIDIDIENSFIKNEIVEDTVISVVEIDKPPPKLYYLFDRKVKHPIPKYILDIWEKLDDSYLGERFYNEIYKKNKLTNFPKIIKQFIIKNELNLGDLIFIGHLNRENTHLGFSIVSNNSNGTLISGDDDIIVNYGDGVTIHYVSSCNLPLHPDILQTLQNNNIKYKLFFDDIIYGKGYNKDIPFSLNDFMMFNIYGMEATIPLRGQQIKDDLYNKVKERFELVDLWK